MYCVAQVREWEAHQQDLQAANGALWVVTADSVDVVRAAANQKGLNLAAFVAVDDSLWTEWQVQNPSRPEIPNPTTYLVGPDGTLIWRETTPKYGARINAAQVIERIEAHRRGELESTLPADSQEPGPVDWNDLVAAEVRPERRGSLLTVTVREGFHVYGRRERLARPLEVWVNGEVVRARIPRGPLLDGTFSFSMKTSEVAGELHYQACSGSLCGPPSVVAWGGWTTP